MRKSSSSAMEKDQQGENAAEVVKPKGRAGSRKAPAKKEKPSPLMDEDDEIESLKDRLDAYRLDSSPELLTEMLKPAEGAGISPEKKVRKMRASPFNKKSGSLLAGIHKEDDAGTGTMPASTSERAVAIDVPAKARPQRANRKQARYVLSDSESEEDSDFEQASEDSDSD